MTECKLRDNVLKELGQSLSEISMEDIGRIAGQLMEGGRIFCDAAGRSRLQVEGFAMRLTQMGLPARIVGEPTTPAITPEDTLLICSASGETPSLVEHARKARSMGVKILLITAGETTSLGKLSHSQVVIKAGSKQNPDAASIQPMGSLFEQSAGLFLDMMVLYLMEKYGITGEEMYRNHSNLE